MEFVGIGDLHLSSQNGHGGFSRFVDDSDGYILSEVQRVIDLAVEKGIEKAIIYGDVCDAVRMSYRAHLQLAEFFRRNKDIDFHVILGNHDKFAKDSHLGHSCEVLQEFRLKNLTVYDEPKTVTFDDGSKVNFLPFPYSNFRKCLNVCHLDLAGAPMDNGRPTKSDVTSKGYHVVSGHIHSSSNFRHTHYSGTLYQLNFGEDVGRKGFHLIECDATDAEVTYVPFTPKYKLQTVIVEDASVLETLERENIFYRLLIPEDADEIDASLYASLNVVDLKRWGSKTELEDLQSLTLEFEELDLDVDAVLNSILLSHYKDDAKRILKVRSQILSRT